MHIQLGIEVVFEHLVMGWLGVRQTGKASRKGERRTRKAAGDRRDLTRDKLNVCPNMHRRCGLRDPEQMRRELRAIDSGERIN